ncbi:hypothetical protein BD779DRAFT_1679782 [Infundibulicybe gibba]|nr:hypothetical protein BD779DRAFT_1679782 [Infundibulicybe gibba]
MVGLWVNRSKELPLDLKLDLSSDDVSVLDALIPQAHRWERVDLALKPDHHSILAPVKGRLQLLKQLEVSSTDTIGFLDFCKGAPQLTEIRLAGVLNPANIMLPWEQFRAILYALERAKNIWACCLDMSTPAWWSVSEILPQLRCHSLNTLIIYWRPEDFRINEFFSSLTFLSLEYLEIRFLPDPDYLPFMDTRYLSELGPTLLKFFGQSSSHLIALTLDDLPVSTTQIVDYLAFMPSLISLDLKYARGEHVIEDEFMKRLTLNHANDLLPRLSTLSLRGQAEFCEKSLDELITSRRDINPQDAKVPLLEKLVLDCFASRDWSFSEPPSIHRFVSEGLDIKYGFYWNIMHLAMDMIESLTLVYLENFITPALYALRLPTLLFKFIKFLSLLCVCMTSGSCFTLSTSQFLLSQSLVLVKTTYSRAAATQHE